MHQKTDETNIKRPDSAVAADTRLVEHIRHDLMRRVIGVALWIALPLLTLSVVDLLIVYRINSSEPAWMSFLLMVAGTALALLLIGRLAPIAPRWRAWMLPGALFLMALLDLAGRGWGGSARVLLLTCAGVVTVFVGGGAGIVVVAMACGLLLIYAAGIHGLVPTVQLAIGTAAEAAMPISGLMAEWAFFGLLATLTVGVTHHLVDSLIGMLGETRGRAEANVQKWNTQRVKVAPLETALSQESQRASYLDAALTVAGRYIAAPNVGVLLNAAAEAIADQFGYTDVSVYLVEDQGECFTLRASSSTEGKKMALRGQRFRRGDLSRVGWVAEHHQAWLPSAVDEPALLDRPADDTAVSSLATLPLLSDGQLVGILDITTASGPQTEDGLSEGALESLSRLAEHLALTIQTARRFSDEVALLEEASPGYRLAEQLVRARTEAEVCERVVGALLTFDPSRVLMVRAPSGKLGSGAGPGSGVQVVAEALPQFTLGSSEVVDERLHLMERDLVTMDPSSLVDFVLLALTLEAPLWLEDLGNLPATLNPEVKGALLSLAEDTDVGGVVFIPLRADAAVRPGGTSRRSAVGGVLVLYHDVHRFVSQEQRLHQFLSELAGIALVRAQSLEALQAHLDRERSISEIGGQIRRSDDVDMILRTSVRELGKVLRAAEGTITLHAGGSAPGTVEASERGTTPNSVGAADGSLCANETAASSRAAAGGFDDLEGLHSAFDQMTRGLRESHRELEEQVAGRLATLRQRLRWLAAALHVSSAVAAIGEPSALLDEAVALISQHFECESAALFLCDDAGVHVELQAAFPRAGAFEVSDNRRTRIGRGTVGGVAQSGEPKITMAVAQDNVQNEGALQPPDAPPEAVPSDVARMTLPLKLGDGVIGVLDVRSRRSRPFSGEDLLGMQYVGDQIVRAIDCARISEAHGQLLQALQARNSAQGVTIRQHLGSATPGYRYTGFGVTPFQPTDAAEPVDASQIVDAEGERRLVAPIIAGDQVLGTLVFEQQPEDIPWGSEELELVNAVCVDIGQALVNAQLLSDSRVRAEREELLRYIGTRMRETLDIDLILQTALREIGQNLSVSSVEVRMQGAERSGPYV